VGEPIGIVKNNDGDPAFVAANGNVYSTNGSSLSFKMGPITLEAGIYPEVLNVNIDPTAEAIGTDGFRYTTHDTSADPLVWSQWSSGYNSLASANYLGSLETIVISSSGLIARITEGEMPYTVRASDGAPFRDIAYAENTGFPEPTLAVYFIVSASGEVIKYEHYSIDYDSISIDISGLPVSLNGVCSYIHEGYIDIYVCGDNGLLMYRRFEPL
jgi:hypothetical protein